MSLCLKCSRLPNKIVVAAALAVCFTLTVIPRLHADSDDCQRRVAGADHRVHEAIEHHGYRSDQAEDARHKLREARENCWKTENKWWDEDNRRWHNDRDWDDHDHDRGHDR